jgi:hypothetical protein
MIISPGLAMQYTALWLITTCQTHSNLYVVCVCVCVCVCSCKNTYEGIQLCPCQVPIAQYFHKEARGHTFSGNPCLPPRALLPRPCLALCCGWPCLLLFSLWRFVALCGRLWPFVAVCGGCSVRLSTRPHRTHTRKHSHVHADTDKR